MLSVIVAGSFFLNSSVEAQSRPRTSSLKRQTVVSSGRNQSDIGFFLNFFGKVPHVSRRSTVDVSVSFDESTINENHPCGLANVVPKDFPYAPYVFNTNATLKVIQFSSGNELHGAITAGQRCPTDPIDGCVADSINIDFSIEGGTGQFVATRAHVTLRLVVKKCMNSPYEIVSNTFTFWDFAKEP